MYSNTTIKNEKMKREKFYDIFAGLMVLALSGAFVWFLTLEKAIPEMQKDIEYNKRDIDQLKAETKKQNEKVIEMLHEIKLELKDKKDREK